MAKKNRHRGKFQYVTPLNKDITKSLLNSPLSEQDEEKKAWERLVGKKYTKGAKNE